MRVLSYRLALGLSVILFASSLALPTFDDVPGHSGGRGILVLAFGWLGLVAAADSVANLAWLANVLVIATWGFVQARMRRSGLTAGLLTVMLAVLPLVTRQVAIDESGFPRPIVAFEIGYVVWAAAMIAGLIAAWLTPPPSDETRPSTPGAAAANRRSPPAPRP